MMVVRTPRFAGNGSNQTLTYEEQQEATQHRQRYDQIRKPVTVSPVHMVCPASVPVMMTPT